MITTSLPIESPVPGAIRADSGTTRGRNRGLDGRGELDDLGSSVSNHKDVQGTAHDDAGTSEPVIHPRTTCLLYTSDAADE